MPHTLTITLDDRTFSDLVATARVRGETPEEIVASAAVKDLYEDPLDRHIGAYPTGVAQWADNVHDVIGQSSMVSEKASTEDT
jgi:hypothetical protein